MGLRTFAHWSLRTKVAAVFGVLLLLTVVAAGWPIWHVYQNRAHGEAINRTGQLRMLSQRLVQQSLLAADGFEEAHRDRRRALEQGERVFNSLLAGPHADLVREAGARSTLKRARNLWRELDRATRTYVARADRRAETGGTEQVGRIQARGDSMLAVADRATGQLEAAARAQMDGAVRLSLFLLAGFVLVGTGTLEGVRRMLIPLGDLTDSVEQIGREGGTVRMETDRGDEIGRLARAFNEMADRLEQRERDLRRAKAHYEQLFEEAPFAITLTRPDGVVVEANGAARSLFGWSFSEERRPSAWEVYEERDRRDEFVRTLEGNGRLEEFEAWLIGADGRPFLASISAVRREDRRPPVYQAMITDITEERENRRRRDVFEQALAQMGDMVLITDEDGTIWYANRAAEAITGYDLRELFGENPRILQSGKTSDHTYSEMWSALTDGEVFQATFVDERKDGTPVHLDQTITPVSVEGSEAVHYVSTGRDVTDRIRREEQLRVLNRVLRHDVGNAATHVMGYADLLANDPPADRRSEYVRIVRNAGAQIARLTASARALMQSMTEDGIETKPVDLRRIVRSEVQSARTLYNEARISLPATGRAVWVEGTRLLGTLVGNLLHNAVQHTDRETVDVELSLERTSEGTVRLRVADDGPGIPDEKKERIFGKDEKGLESSGTGMGLYLARRVAEQCDGRIWVEDNAPRGSIFVTELPLSESSRGAEDEEIERDGTHPGPHGT